MALKRKSISIRLAEIRGHHLKGPLTRDQVTWLLKLIETLSQYADHRYGCAKGANELDRCSCGFIKAMTEEVP